MITRTRRWIAPRPVVLIAAMIVVGANAPSFVNADMPPMTTDGWHTWRVQAVKDAPGWCCYRWRDDKVAGNVCDLDDDRNGFASSERGDPAPGEMQIFARIEAGQPVAIRALSTTCPVVAASRRIDHGRLKTKDSVVWLARLINPRSHLSADVIAAIAVHAGTEASDALVRSARHNEQRQNRMDAMFWIGQLRMHDSADALHSLMFDDPDPAVREHAAFAWSQSNLAMRGVALDRLGRTDADAGVRGKAWFWLAQTGAADSEERILSALDNETSRRTRDDAIFALSQLAQPRGVDALIVLLENRNAPESDRKKALFWLAQSSSDRAHEYLARVLD